MVKKRVSKRWDIVTHGWMDHIMKININWFETDTT